MAAAGGDKAAGDDDAEEVSKKDLKKVLKGILEKTKTDSHEAIDKNEFNKMAKQLLGMVATVDREREHLRLTSEAYAKLVGENVDLLGKEHEAAKVSLKATAKAIMRMGAAKAAAAAASKNEEESSKDEDEELSQQLTRESTAQLGAADTSAEDLSSA